ncbi:Exportin-6-like protein, partial [Globisporangium splendens]
MSTAEHSHMIAEVEGALARLLDPNTPAAEKAHLEQQLTNLKDAPHACLPVLYQLLSTSSNEYALWFAATTMEEYVAKKWHRLQPHEQQHFRQFAWKYLLAAPAAVSTQTAFVVRKLRKVVADIARIEWKVNAESEQCVWPEFMSQVEAMVIETNTRQSGLELLCVVAEEFGREDALAFASVKRQAKVQLIAQLPSILTLLLNILRGCNHHLQQQNESIVEQDRIAQVALETLNHLIAWAPVAEHMNEAWIGLLFELSMNWQHVHARGMVSHMCTSSVSALQCLTELMNKRFSPTSIDEIVGQVMFCLCPLLQKTVQDQVIGRATEEYLDKLSEFVEMFLTQHLKKLENPKYQAVLPDFLQLVLALTSKQPHVDGFLNCLSVWEVFVGYIEEVEMNEGASNERVRQALNVYENGLISVMFHLLERVSYASNKNQLDELEDDDEGTGSSGNNGGDSGDGHSSFDLERSDSLYGTGSLQDLAQLSVAKTSGGNGAVSAVELSDRKQFVVDCIALIRRIAAFPACAPPLLERLVPRVQETCQNLIFHLHETPAYPPHSDAWEQERCAIRDLTTNCAVLSSVCAQFYSTSQDMNNQMAGWQILHLFITLSEYIVQHRLQTRGDVFVELQCEGLTSVRFCLSCIPFVLQSGAREDVLRATESVLQVLLHTLDTTIVPSPQVVMQNSMQLLANIGFVLSYDDLIQVPSMSQLEGNIHQFSLHLPLTIQGDLYTSMSNSILNSAISLRGTGASGANEASAQKWGEAYGQLILPIRESIEQSALTLQQNENRVLERVMVAQIQRDCFLVRCLAQSVETKPKVAKDAFFSAYQSTFPSLMSLMTSYFAAIRKTAASGGNNAQAHAQVKNALKVVNEIIRLYAQLLKSIRKEMQKESVAELMRVFVEIFSDSQLSSILNNHGNSGSMVLCGFLQLLKIVVEEPTSVFASFLQNILELCFGPLKESIVSHPESDSVILGYFIGLVEQLLEKHYRFFVSPSVTFNAEGQRERGYSSEIAHTYFLSIFQSVASVLSREGSNLSPRLCGQVLALLDRVDKAQGLFSFAGFQRELRMGFLSTLMNLLTRGEMNLLQEEVIQLLHRVAAADFGSFYQVFLPAYIKDILTPQEYEAASRQNGEFLRWSGQVDLPTFSQEVIGFLNDLRVLKSQS